MLERMGPGLFEEDDHEGMDPDRCHCDGSERWLQNDVRAMFYNRQHNNVTRRLTAWINHCDHIIVISISIIRSSFRTSLF